MVDAEGKPAGWRGYLGHRQHQLRERARRVDPRGRRRRSTSFASGSRSSSTTWSPLPPSSPWSKTSTSDLGRRLADGEVRHDRDATDHGDSPGSRSARPGLRKSFGKQVVLDGIDLEVAEGTVFALLGPNGAGKTTMVRILSTLIAADGGEVADRRPRRGPRARCGSRGHRRHRPVLGGRRAVHRRGEPPADGGSPASATSRTAGGESPSCSSDSTWSTPPSKPVATYSGGMRRRLDLAMTLIGEPRIIFLDEPTAGLDPRSRRGMWQTIRELVASGVTIFLTTQYLEEADRLAHRIGVLDQGPARRRGHAGRAQAAGAGRPHPALVQRRRGARAGRADLRTVRRATTSR